MNDVGPDDPIPLDDPSPVPMDDMLIAWETPPLPLSPDEDTGRLNDDPSTRL